MKLIVSNTCPYAQRSWITVKALGLDCDIEIIDLKNKPNWFLKLTAFAKVPVLIDAKNRVLWESLVVSNYLNQLSNRVLSPADDFENAINEAWIAQLEGLMSMTGGLTRANSSEERAAALRLTQKKFMPLEMALSAGPFFNGEQFCMIDIFYAPLFLRLNIIAKYFGLDLYQGLPKVGKWAQNCIAHPAVEATIVPDFDELFCARFVAA